MTLILGLMAIICVVFTCLVIQEDGREDRIRREGTIRGALLFALVGSVFGTITGGAIPGGPYLELGALSGALVGYAIAIIVTWFVGPSARVR